MTEHTQLNPHDSPSLTHLAQAAMPADTQQLIDNVDSIVESAKRVIDLSLKQSGTLIEQSQQQLDTLPKSTASAITAQPKTEQQQAIKDQRALEKQQFEYQKNMLEQQEKNRQMAQLAQQKMAQTSVEMGQQLLAQQQAYESKINQYSSEKLTQISTTTSTGKVDV